MTLSPLVSRTPRWPNSERWPKPHESNSARTDLELRAPDRHSPHQQEAPACCLPRMATATALPSRAKRKSLDVSLLVQGDSAWRPRPHSLLPVEEHCRVLVQLPRPHAVPDRSRRGIRTV